MLQNDRELFVHRQNNAGQCRRIIHGEAATKRGNGGLGRGPGQFLIHRHEQWPCINTLWLPERPWQRLSAEAAAQLKRPTAYTQFNGYGGFGSVLMAFHASYPHKIKDRCTLI